MLLAAAVGAVALTGCSGGGVSDACARLGARLVAIDDQVDRLGDQSWEQLQELQRLGIERTSVRREQAAHGCASVTSRA